MDVPLCLLSYFAKSAVEGSSGLSVVIPVHRCYERDGL